MMQALVGIMAIVGLTGCATGIGPKRVAVEHNQYNQHMARSMNEQMLLNLVRLRYDDPPLFLELGTIVAQYTLEGRASAGGVIGVGGADTESSLGVGVTYAERPTVTYTPLRGDEFANRVLSSISPETIVLLSQSGWSIERLLLLCVQRINGIENAVTATGPTPMRAPEFERFQRFAAMARRLQLAGLFNASLDVEPKENVTRLTLTGSIDPDSPHRSEMDSFRRMLGLTPDRNQFRLTGSAINLEPDEIAVNGRSMLGVLFFLSQAVEPPERDVRDGVVAVTRDENGDPFDWSRVTGKVMRIRSGDKRPDRAFAAVRYRDSWFYIDDRDIDSKRSFGLLTYLFSLQSAGGSGRSPLLTLPAGG